MEGPESKFKIVNYFTKTNNKIEFIGAPLSIEETTIFDQVYNQNTHLFSKEHTALLNLLLKTNQSKQRLEVL